MLAGRVLSPGTNNQYSALAAALLDGRLDVSGVTGSDVTVHDGRVYLPVPFLPAIPLMPFVLAFGPGVYEGIACALAGLVNLALFQRLLGRIGCRPAARPWLIALFGFGSLHFAAVAGGGNWLLSHLVATTLLLLLLFEAFGPNRPWLLGALLGAATLARPSVWFLLPFPLLAAWAAGRDPGGARRHATRVIFGVLPFVAIWLGYNQARFGDPFDDGYAAITVPPCLGAAIESHGLHSLAYLPRNLGLLLFHGPEPVPGDGVRAAPWGQLANGACATTSSAALDATTLAFPYWRPSEWGMGLLWTMPAAVWSFAAPWRDRWTRLGWLGIASSLAVMLTYASPGWIQFGARYTLDFLPLLLLLIVRGLSDTPPRAFKALVILSIAVQLWGVTVTYWLPSLT